MKTKEEKGEIVFYDVYRFFYPVIFLTLLLCLTGKSISLNATKSNLFTLFFPLIRNGDVLIEADDQEIRWIEESGPGTNSFAEAVTLKFGEHEYVYVIGGSTESANRSRLVTHAEIQQNGSLGTWNKDDPLLPLALKGHSVVAKNNLIYVFGGENNLAGGDQAGYSHFVYCAELDAETGKIIGDWNTLPGELPKQIGFQTGVAFHASVLESGGNYVYLIGGTRKNAYDHITYTNHVWSAEINSSCDEALEWRPEVPLLEENGIAHNLANHTAISLQHQGKELLFVFGGGTREYNHSTVMVTEIDNKGRIQEWQILPKFGSQALQLLTAVQSGNYLYLLGGSSHTLYNCFPGSIAIYRAKLVEVDDTSDITKFLTDWELLSELPVPVYGHAAVTSEMGRIYLIGGTRNTVISNSTDNKCYLDDFNQSLETKILDTVYWTPLVFFSKESTPQGSILPGQEISYDLIATSNNVRDLYYVTVTDMLPSNVQVVSAPGFIQRGQVLTASVATLPINYQAKWTFTAVVSPTETPTPTGSITTPNPEPQSTSTLTPTPEVIVPPTGSTIRPTRVKGCVEADVLNNNGTPRPKPTCTPTPPVSVSATPSSTNTATPTATNTPTDTPTFTPTPLPEPVIVLNRAFFCFVVEDRQWCKPATAVNAPFRTYLPIVVK